MICPKCKSDTRVKDSRPHVDDPTVIRRRRECDGCGHKFNTFEGTVDLVRHRASVRERQARYREALGPEERSRRAKRDNTRAVARAEAAAANQPVGNILARWNGVAVPSGSASPNP